MFAVNTSNVKPIYSYDDAKRVYESIKPIRGNSQDIRPLGKRYAQHMRIQKNNVDGMEVYECILFTTPCVTWYPDGKILLKTGGWRTASTARFIDAVICGGGAYLSHGHICALINLKCYPVPKNGLWLQNNGDTWSVLNPPQVYVPKLNRTEAKRIRTLAKPILNYFKVMTPLVSDTLIDYDAFKAAMDRLKKRCDLGVSVIASMSILGWALKQQDVDLEVLADLMVVLKNRFTLKVLYKSALANGVTDFNTLYDKEYLEPGVIAKDMRVETEMS